MLVVHLRPRKRIDTDDRHQNHSYLAVVTMVTTIAYGLFPGNFSAEIRPIWAMPWSKVMLVGTYFGLGILPFWVAARERRLPIKLLGWMGLVVLGKLVYGFFLLLASFASSNIRELLLGKRADLSVEP